MKNVSTKFVSLILGFLVAVGITQVAYSLIINPSSSQGGGDTSGLVPYTGATANVDLGSFELTAAKLKLPFQGVLESLDSGASPRSLISIGGTDHVEIGGDATLDTDVYAVGLLSFLSPVSYVNGKLGVATTTPDVELVVEGQSLFTSTSTFLGGLLSNNIHALNSSGFQILNSQGTLVGTFGSANTTNASIAGALSLGGALTGVTTLTSSGTSTLATGGGNVGVGTTTPLSKLSLASGSIAVSENTLATSTSMTIDFTNGNTQLIRMGTSATTIGFSNNAPGAVVKLVICNPAGGSAGAITWSGVTWSGGTIPTQTTSANKCDVWSFLSTNATSTLRIFGSASTNF